MRAAVASFRDAASLPVERQDWFTLGSVFEPLLPARFPPGHPVKVTPIRETPDHCRVLEAADIGHFHVRTRPQWASYADIASSFESSRGPSHLSRIPESLLGAPVKLLLADHSRDLKCALFAERVYPKRAWIGALLPGWDLEMAFAATGILNSAAGLVLYRALAKRGGITGREISKKVLEQFPLPLPSRNPDAFRRVALLSYRIHLLHQAPAEEPDLDSLITNHCLRLLSEIVDLYGWSEDESRELLQEAQGLGRRDLSGDQGNCSFSFARHSSRSPRCHPRKPAVMRS